MSWIPGGYEWLIVLLVAFLLFGKRLPSLGRSLGECVGLFKRGVDKSLGYSDDDEG
jgi:sec-independent protein translocase protein TatA